MNKRRYISEANRLFTTTILILVAFTFFFISAQAQKRSPVKVILDTDIDSDVDDVGALAMLHAMMSNGEVEILAVMVSSTCPYSAACVDAINTYYGRPDMPIGVKKGKGVCRNSHYTDKVAKKFPHDLVSGTNAPDAKVLYRRILAGLPDKSVKIISIGYFTNLADLLKTSGDSISNLDGEDLVNKKVIELVSTGGNYPKDLSYQGNGNFEPDGKAVQYVNEHWPTTLTFVSGEKWFWDVQTGAKLMKECDPDKNPVAYAYKEFHAAVDWDYLNPEHHSADQMGVYEAIKGFGNKYMVAKTSGYFHIWDNGLCEWRDDHNEPLRRVVYNLKEPYSKNATKLAEEIETLMMQDPKQENGVKILDKKLTDFTLSDGEEYKLINSAIKQDYNIFFSGNIVDFDTLIIGKGSKSYLSSSITITRDSVIFNKIADNKTKKAYKHHLRLKNNLTISIDRKLNSAIVTIINEKDTFKIKSDFVGMKKPFIRSLGSVINVKEFSFTYNDYNSDIFIFGDSYVNCAPPSRWPYYLYKKYKFFCDGFPGGTSVDSYDFLRSALSVHKPKYVIWCLGMNDGSDDQEINPTWKHYVKEVMALCSRKDITLIFATVPTVPTRNNRGKNRFVRESGYRYIDFDKAVSDGNGNWKKGMLYDDGVHPTEKGAKALAERFLKDFPEIKNYTK